MKPLRPPDVKRPGSAPARPGREIGSLRGRASDDSTPTRPFRVVVVGINRSREWGKYAEREEAERNARQLRRHGFDARLVVAS